MTLGHVAIYLKQKKFKTKICGIEMVKLILFNALHKT